MESSPIVQVRLNPPAHSQPQVTAELAKLEQAESALEEEQLAALQVAYDTELAAAKTAIAQLVGREAAKGNMRVKRPSSFLAVSDSTAKAEDDFTVKLWVAPVAPPDPILKEQIDAIEGFRAKKEKRIFQQAMAEFAGLTKIVLSQLKVELAEASSSQSLGWLQAAERDLPHQANIRVMSGQPFPSIEGMVMDMELRRDGAEGKVMSAILDLESKLLQAENDAIGVALKRSA